MKSDSVASFAAAAAVNDRGILSQCLLASPDIASGVLGLSTYEGFNSASLAYNRALGEATADILILVHQDVYLPSGFLDQLRRELDRLDGIDPDWAVAGVVGMDHDGHLLGRVWSSGMGLMIGGQGRLPARTETLDEMILILRTRSGLRFDEKLRGFHLYAADIIQIAASKGLGSWVVDAPAVHHSRPVINLGGSYAECWNYLRGKWRDRLPIQNLVCPLTASPTTLWKKRIKLSMRQVGKPKRVQPTSDPVRIARDQGLEIGPDRDPAATPQPVRMNGAAVHGPRTLNMVLGMPLAMRGPGYTFGRLAEGMNDPSLPCRIFAPVDRWPEPGLGLPTVTGAVGSDQLLSRLPYRVVGGAALHLTGRRLLDAVQAQPDRHIVYFWGELPLSLSRALHRRGVTVVREKFNSGKAGAKRILDEAYAKIGEPPAHSITDAQVAKEYAELQLADAVYCPSPMVTQSLLELGLPAEKLIPTSYGWEPQRLLGVQEPGLAPIDGTTFLFVGTICVRKGAHILLEAWARAGLPGRLVLAGGMEPVIARLYADILARPDVIHVPYTPNIAALYRSSDWFIFPSLEEGGPQVTYEAAGVGVPSIVSPMGAGAFTRHGVDGLIVPSDEPDAWTRAMQQAAGDREARDVMGAAARAHADHFTWDKVATRRREALLERFG